MTDVAVYTVYPQFSVGFFKPSILLLGFLSFLHKVYIIVTAQHSHGSLHITAINFCKHHIH